MKQSLLRGVIVSGLLLLVFCEAACRPAPPQSDSTVQARRPEPTNMANTNEPQLGRPELPGAGSNQFKDSRAGNLAVVSVVATNDSDLFKTVIDTNTGIYFATDSERRELFLKMKNGNIFAKRDVLEFLNVGRTSENDTQRITSIYNKSGNIIISVGGTNYTIPDANGGTRANP